MSVIERGPTQEWPWPVSLYEHGAGRELSTAQRDDYKKPVVAVVPAEQIQGAVEALDAIAKVLDRGIPDDRKLATVTRLVHAARPTGGS